MTLLKGLAIVLAAAFAFTGFALVVRAIGTIGRGVGALVGAFGKAGGAVETLGGTIARVFGANSTVMKILRGVGGLVAGIGAGVLAAMGLGGGGSNGTETTAGSTQPGTMGAYRSRANSAPSDIPIRVVEPPKATLAASKELAKTSVALGKELTGQLDAVQSLADGYRRAAQANMDRMTIEMDILNLTKEEADTIKGIAEINKRYADQVAALEDKKKGAKGATLALIDKEIANLEDLRTSELDIFNITREKTREYARQQQEIKNIVEQMEQQAEYAREIAEFQNQQQQAVLTAFEQVRAQREALELTGQREQLEKSIQNLRGSDQATTRQLFDLETQRKEQLEAIRKIQNLPFEGQGGMKQRLQEINDLYDARRAQIEATAAATKAEQDSFASGWANAGEKFRNNIKTDAEYAAQQLSNFTKGFEDAFVKFVQTGKLSFKDLANSMIADFARIQAQRLLTSFMGGGGGGGFFGSIGKIFGFANGGMPPVGVPSLVGERGPELFVPQNAGKIIPNHKLGLGGQSVINNTTEVSYNIQAVDSASFQQLVASDPKFLHAVVEKGRRSLPQGGRR
jgi:lambda family phage tail tape measure protein